MSSYDRREKNIFASRYRVIAGFIVLMMMILAIRLFVVTIIQHETWSSLAEGQSTKQITTSAARGNIYDRNGKLLAGNTQVFSATFSVSGMKTEEINASALSLMNLLEANGDKVTDDFPIKFDSDGSMHWSYDDDLASWLDGRGYNENLTAEEAFQALRNEYGVDEELTRYEAYTLLTETYSINVPISVRTMTYVYDQQKTNFLSKWNSCFTSEESTSGVEAEAAFNKLKKYYSMDDLSDADARKILLVRNRVITNGATYIPVTISKSVSNETIAYLEEGGISGADISSSYIRNYPEGSTAAHVIGYMGSISETYLSTYLENGYTSSDLVGQSGVESSYESQLHGTDGVTTIQVNSSGEQVSVLSETDPVKGKDVYLTIDLDLQQVAEESLANAVANANSACQSGATVCMDVETGEILAMASYPTFDLNIFANGITTEAWASVQSSNPRDPIAPTPLYNNATMAAAPPGSTFKPLVALTALELGLNKNTYITDRGYIQIGDIQWKTSAYNISGTTMGAENLALGLGHSSNYYFYCVATGKDWGTGASLGYEISIDDILDKAKQFGLGKKTGIEIGELVASTPSEENKIYNYKISCWNYLYEHAHDFWEDDIADDYDKLSEQIDIIVSWLEETPTYAEVVSRMQEQTKMKADQIETAASHVKFDYFDQAHWTTGDQFNIGIGQGDNLYTPLQVCTYAAAIANGAVYNRARLIDAVQGEGVVDSSGDSYKIESVSDEDLEAVYDGLKAVTSIGSLTSFFSSFPYKVMGKTGTAENQGTPQPASEIEYIKEHLASLNASAGTSITWEEIEEKMEELMKSDPVTYASEEDTVDRALKELSNYAINQSMINADKGSYQYYAWTMSMAPADNPKIAVVTMLIQGGFSASAAPVNRDVTKAYFEMYGGVTSNEDKSGTVTTTTMMGTNTAN